MLSLRRLLFAQSRLFYREMDCPVRFHREMDCPVRWSLATPSALESQPRAEQGLVVENPICKCRRHKAGHLQVRVAVGRRSTCVLKEVPLNKGPLGFPHFRVSPIFAESHRKLENFAGTHLSNLVSPFQIEPLPNPRDPPVLQILRRVDSARGANSLWSFWGH